MSKDTFSPDAPRRDLIAPTLLERIHWGTPGWVAWGASLIGVVAGFELLPVSHGEKVRRARNSIEHGVAHRDPLPILPGISIPGWGAKNTMYPDLRMYPEAADDQTVVDAAIRARGPAQVRYASQSLRSDPVRMSALWRSWPNITPYFDSVLRRDPESCLVMLQARPETFRTFPDAKLRYDPEFVLRALTSNKDIPWCDVPRLFRRDRDFVNKLVAESPNRRDEVAAREDDVRWGEEPKFHFDATQPLLSTDDVWSRLGTAVQKPYDRMLEIRRIIADAPFPNRQATDLAAVEAHLRKHLGPTGFELKDVKIRDVEGPQWDMVVEKEGHHLDAQVKFWISRPWVLSVTHEKVSVPLSLLFAEHALDHGQLSLDDFSIFQRLPFDQIEVSCQRWPTFFAKFESRVNFGTPANLDEFDRFRGDLVNLSRLILK